MKITFKIIYMRFFCYLPLVVLLFFSCSSDKYKVKIVNRSEFCNDNINSKPKNVHVFVENSPSMDGYVKGVTDFKIVINNLLTTIENDKEWSKPSMQFHFVNGYGCTDNLAANVSDYIDCLDPTQFKKWRVGGDTDVANALKKVLDSTNNDDISIFVTDGVISLDAGKYADSELRDQQNNIMLGIEKKLVENSSFGVVIYKFDVPFKGKYYNKNNVGIDIDADRPFYIWFMGNSSMLASLKNILDKRVGIDYLKNEFVFLPFSSNDIYVSLTDSILSEPDYSFECVLKTKHKLDIQCLKSFNNMKYTKDTFMPVADGTINYKYYLEPKKDYPNAFSLRLEYRDSVKDAFSNISLEEINDDEGDNPVPGKTYGIKYQILGVKNAFENKNKLVRNFNVEFYFEK